MNLKILTTDFFVEKLGYEASPLFAGFVDVFFCGEGVPDSRCFTSISVFSIIFFLKCKNISSQSFATSFDSVLRELQNESTDLAEIENYEGPG